MKKTLSQIKLKRGVKYGIVSPPNSPEIDDDFVTDHIAYSGQSFESGPQQWKQSSALLPTHLLL